MKVLENKASERTEAQDALFGAMEDMFKTTIQALTKEVGKLATIVKEQAKHYDTLNDKYNALSEKYDSLKDSVTSQLEGLKADLTASIST
jgi:hypothetical protein